MMIRTFSFFGSETSLREQRFIYESGNAETTQEPTSQPEIPTTEQLETPTPTIGSETSEALDEGVQATASAKLTEAGNVALEQQNAQENQAQKVENLKQEAGSTPETTTEIIDPAIAEEIQKLPQSIQAPVLSMINEASSEEKLEFIQFVQNMAQIGPEAFKTVLELPIFNEQNQLKTNDELAALKSVQPENPSAQATLDLLIGLSAPARAIAEKIVSAGKELHEKSKEAPLSSDVAQEVKVQHERWKNATTQEERDIAEGRMLLVGAVVDEKGNVTTHTPPTFADIVMGLYKLITGLFGQLSGKKTKVDEQVAEKEQVPADKLTPEERAKEITEIETELKTSEEIKVKLGKDVKTLKEEILTATDEAKPEMEKRLEGMQKQLAELEAAMAVKKARLEELKKVRENTSAVDASPEAPLPNNPEEEKLLDAAKTDYLVAEGKSGTNVSNDIEYSNSHVSQENGYIPYLEALLTEVQDNDEWTGDSNDEQKKETALLQSAAQAVQKNLQVLAITLDKAENKGSPAYENLRKTYVEKSARFTELVANVDEEFENSDLRNPDMAAEQAEATIAAMTTEEAISWVTKTMATIDGNNWQSSGLKETYGKLSLACQSGMEKKLGEEKIAAMNNPEAMKAHVKHCMDIAKLFTGRTDIDSDLTNIDFAISMAKEAMDFPDLALRYQETALKKQNPIQWHLELHTPVVLAKTTNLPAELRDNPEVKSMLATLNTKPTSIEEQAQHYAILRSLDAILSKQPQPDVQAELDAKMGPFLDQSYEAFETFLNGTWAGAEDLNGINAAIGDPQLSATQIEAWELLSDIQGYGYFNPSDHSWNYVGTGFKITAMIAGGVGVGMATGGLGILAAALAGGATMTAANAVINQQGFDGLEDAAKTYGTDLGVNTVTMGAARYLAAGRAAYQLSRGGLLAETGGVREVMKIASKQGGGRLLASLDDASHIGTRLVGAGAEGAADVLVGTTLDTTLRGGEFVDNLQSNAMFFGLSFAEFGPSALKGLRRMPQEELHGLAQIVNKVNVQKADLQTLCGPTVSVKNLLESADPRTLLASAALDEETVVKALAAIDTLKQTKGEFETSFKEAATQGAKAEAATEGQPKESAAKAETAEEAELAKSEASIREAELKFEQSVRERIDQANGGYIPEVKMTGEFLMKAGLSHKEILYAKNLGILVDDGGLYIVAKTENSNVATQNNTPLGDASENSQAERLQAAEKQVIKALTDDGLEASERKFYEYSLKDIQIQKNTSLTALEKAEARFQALENYDSSGSTHHHSTARKVVELHKEIASLKEKVIERKNLQLEKVEAAKKLIQSQISTLGKDKRAKKPLENALGKLNKQKDRLGQPEMTEADLQETERSLQALEDSLKNIDPNKPISLQDANRLVTLAGGHTPKNNNATAPAEKAVANDAPKATTPDTPGVPRRMLDGLQSRIGAINLKSLKATVEWATTTFKSLPKTLQDIVKPLFDKFIKSIKDLPNSSRENLATGMKNVNDAYAKFRAAVNEFLTRSEYRNKQNAAKAGPEVALDTSVVPAVTDIPRVPKTVAEVRAKYEAALKQDGLSPEKKAKYNHILEDLDIQDDKTLSRLEKAEKRLKLLEDHEKVVSDTDPKLIQKVKEKLKARIAEIKSQAEASESDQVLRSEEVGGVKDQPSAEDAEIAKAKEAEQELTDGDLKTSQARNQLDEAAGRLSRAYARVKAAEQQYGDDMVPEYTKNEYKSAQKALDEAEAGFNDVQKSVRNDSGTPSEDAAGKPGSILNATLVPKPRSVAGKNSIRQRAEPNAWQDKPPRIGYSPKANTEPEVGSKPSKDLNRLASTLADHAKVEVSATTKVTDFCGLPPDASLEEIKAAAKKITYELHPDSMKLKGGATTASTQNFKIASDLYRSLKSGKILPKGAPIGSLKEIFQNNEMYSADSEWVDFDSFFNDLIRPEKQDIWADAESDIKANGDSGKPENYDWFDEGQIDDFVKSDWFDTNFGERGEGKNMWPE